MLGFKGVSQITLVMQKLVCLIFKARFMFTTEYYDHNAHMRIYSHMPASALINVPTRNNYTIVNAPTHVKKGTDKLMLYFICTSLLNRI